MTAATSNTDEKSALRSVNRALDVLQALGSGSSQGMAVGEIAEAIGVSRSTVFTLLQTLMTRGFVADRRIGAARLYRLGPTLISLGDRASSDISITQIAFPILQRLTEETRLTSRLAILDDGCAVTLSHIDAPGPFRVTASLGQRELPHCSSLGKALMSRLPEDEVTAFVERLGMPQRTIHTLTTPEALIRDLRLSNLRGYAFDNEEDNIGVICVGAAIYDRSGQVNAAISVTGIKLINGSANLDKLGLIVRVHADEISNLLGGPTHADLMIREAPSFDN